MTFISPSLTARAAALAVGITFAASALGAGNALSGADRRFVDKAATAGMAEVELGQIAQQKAQSEQIKQFAARMVQDHGKANDELKQVASAKGVTLPASLDSKHAQDKKKLQQLSGAAFDREYARHMVADHRQAVADFQKQAKSGQDAELKAFADKTLPTLQEHLTMSQSLAGSAQAR